MSLPCALRIPCNGGSSSPPLPAPDPDPRVAPPGGEGGGGHPLPHHGLTPCPFQTHCRTGGAPGPPTSAPPLSCCVREQVGGGGRWDGGGSWCGSGGVGAARGVPAACTVRYLGSVLTEALTGPRAVALAADAVLGAPPPPPCTAHFHVSARGITLTDRQRRWEPPRGPPPSPSRCRPARGLTSTPITIPPPRRPPGSSSAAITPWPTSRSAARTPRTAGDDGGGAGGGSRSWAGGAQSDAAPLTQVGERGRHHLHVSSGGGALNTALTSCPLSAVYPPRPPPGSSGSWPSRRGGRGATRATCLPSWTPSSRRAPSSASSPK